MIWLQFAGSNVIFYELDNIFKDPFDTTIATPKL